MMDIDYGKLISDRGPRMPNQQRHMAKKPAFMPKQGPSAAEHRVSNKTALIISLAIIFFTIGLLSGIYYQKNRSQPEGSIAGLENNQLANLGNPRLEDFNANTSQNGTITGEDSELAKSKIKSGVAKNNQALLEKLREVGEENQEPTLVKNAASARNAVTKNGESSSASKLESFHILAKKYDSEKEAMFYGKKLKAMNLGARVFLAKSRDKMKVYIGPIQGQKEAYNIMKTVKGMDQFKGAILYKN